VRKDAIGFFICLFIWYFIYLFSLRVYIRMHGTRTYTWKRFRINSNQLFEEFHNVTYQKFKFIDRDDARPFRSYVWK